MKMFSTYLSTLTLCLCVFLVDDVARAGSATSAQTVPQAKLTAADEPGGGLGSAVALAGTRALVGAPYDNGDAGSAYVFVKSGQQWTQEAKLTPSDAATGALFGWSVSLFKDTAIVGAPYIDGVSHPGETYVFVRNGTVWTQTAILAASDHANDNYFGNAVAIFHDSVVVGAPGGARGEAYVFVGNGTNWTQQAILQQAGVSNFGQAVSVSENEALIGGAVNTLSQQNIAYIYAFDGTAWTLQASLTPPGNEATDLFGQSVSIVGARALIGAPGVNFFGAGYIYTFNGTSWVETQELIASDQPDNSELGTSVALSGNGALLGAPGAGENFTGSAILFIFNGTTWTQAKTITAPDAMQMAAFGSSVAIGSGFPLIGAPGQTETNPYDGAAYLFGRH